MGKCKTQRECTNHSWCHRSGECWIETDAVQRMAATERAAQQGIDRTAATAFPGTQPATKAQVRGEVIKAMDELAAVAARPQYGWCPHGVSLASYCEKCGAARPQDEVTKMHDRRIAPHSVFPFPDRRGAGPEWTCKADYGCKTWCGQAECAHTINLAAAPQEAAPKGQTELEAFIEAHRSLLEEAGVIGRKP